MTPVIETDRLGRDFGEKRVVDGLNLSVEPGSVYAFLGSNGAGKTTTIRMLLGLIRPTRGTVRLFGKPFARRLLGRAGSLVEMPSYYGHLTGRENLELVRRIAGRANADTARALETVRLASDADRLAGTYSLGMRQRLGLAMALLGDPELLILDEPTNGLDPAGIREIRELIAGLSAREGVTIFLSSHLLTEVNQVATHVGILERGRLLFQGPMAELKRRFQPSLEVRTNRLADAARLLAARQFSVEPDGAETILVRCSGTGDAAALNEILVTAGFSVHHLRLRTASLEQMFLEMTTREEEGCCA
jgi:lantibiotic transport system ATP-binding protein